MSLTTKAIWIVERDMHREISLSEISDACGASQFQLSHAFSRVTGIPIISYLRGRRLSEAAILLADGHGHILGLALDSGYGSHEAFSRAFKSQFGSTPEEVRRRGAVDGLALIRPFHLPPSQEFASMTPKIVQGEAIKAVGLASIYEMGKVEGIARQWPAFMSRIHLIENKRPAAPLGISRMTGNDNEFEYLCAAEVSAPKSVPDGMIAIDIPATIQSTYSAIWDRWLPASGRKVVDAPSLEIHAPTFDPVTGNGGVGIWIPVE
jgi:AraC family transcriptional regulator